MASEKSWQLMTKFVPAPKKHRFSSGLGALLPESYRKFWNEWKTMRPVAVHYIPEEGRWKRNEVTGEVLPVQNIPLPLKKPAELHKGIWGGEAVVQGFYKKFQSRRVPRFWVPQLKRSVVYSEVLNVYLSVVVTNRTINLINDNYGFDHYLLKTPACDLQSILALKLKQKILKALHDGCPAYEDPEKKAEIYEDYKKYLSAYTAEDIEWYGLTWEEAMKKMAAIERKKNKPVPLKTQYRSELIEQLKNMDLADVKEQKADQMPGASWLQKINPFGSKQK